MARWYQEGSANTKEESEVDQACPQGPWTLWNMKDIQFASNLQLLAENATTSSSVGGPMYGL
jgi:hypothetical protein